MEKYLLFLFSKKEKKIKKENKKYFSLNIKRGNQWGHSLLSIIIPFPSLFFKKIHLINSLKLAILSVINLIKKFSRHPKFSFSSKMAFDALIHG